MKNLFIRFSGLLLGVIMAACILAACDNSAQSSADNSSVVADYTEGLTYSMNVDYNADDEGSGGAEYNTCTLTGLGAATDKVIVIPEKHNGLTVTAISEGAFEGEKDIIDVVFPKGLTKIGAFAFADCTGLTTLTLGDGVKTIGDSAFKGCVGLKKVVFGANVERISEDAFYECKNLKTLSLDKNLKTIDDFAFNKCTALSVVYYNGTPENREAINVETMFNSYLYKATWYYYSEARPALNETGDGFDGNYFYYNDEGVETVWAFEIQN